MGSTLQLDDALVIEAKVAAGDARRTAQRPRPIGADPHRAAAHVGDLLGLLRRPVGAATFSADEDTTLVELARQVALALHNVQPDGTRTDVDKAAGDKAAGDKSDGAE